MQLHVVAGPLARCFEVRQRLGQPTRPVQREAEHLLRLAPLHASGSQLRSRREQQLDGLLMVIGVVLGQAAQVRDEGIVCLEFPEAARAPAPLVPRG